MQLQKIQLYIILMFMSLLCLNGQAENPIAEASDYIEQGREKLSAGDYAGAIADFDSALQIDPEDPEAYYYRASAKFELGKAQQGTGKSEQAKSTYRSAIEDYTKVITLDPEMPGAYIFAGSVHLRLGGLADNEGNSEQAKAFYIQGRVKAALSDYTGAIADFERVIAIKPDYALAYYAQGLAKQALGQDDAAEFDFAKARVLNPDIDKLYPFSHGGEE